MYNKLMHAPLNIIHLYAALPVCLYLAVSGIYKRHVQNAWMTKLFAITAALFFLCLCFYCFPPLISTDPQFLTIANIIGDSLQFSALFAIWLILIRAYLGASGMAHWIGRSVAGATSLLASLVSIRDNLADPVTLIEKNGSWHINYPSSFLYNLITAILFFGAVLLGIFFWRSAGQINDKLQSLRLRGFGVLMIAFGLAYVSRPFTQKDISGASMIWLAIVYTCFFIYALIVSLAKKKQQPL